MSEPRHVPVLMAEVLEALEPRRFRGRPSRWLDGTLGLGGHAGALLEEAGEGAWLLGLDRDPRALEIAAGRLEPRAKQLRLLQRSYAELQPQDWAGWGPAGEDFPGFDGILLDLGVSSLQLDSPGRGFSFQQEGPLDMRMDPLAPLDAAGLLKQLDEAELADMLREYGEERRARPLARAVLKARDAGELQGTRDLARVAERVLGRQPPGAAHPATRLFQALRIAVNAELQALERGLPALAARLAKGGRMAVISFHSLEDRRVKEYFRRESRDCICPPGFPECRCGHRAWLRPLSPRPRSASPAEVQANPRSRSAKLRAVERT